MELHFIQYNTNTVYRVVQFAMNRKYLKIRFIKCFEIRRELLHTMAQIDMEKLVVVAIDDYDGFHVSEFTKLENVEWKK